jgi:hypothetical protein
LGPDDDNAAGDADFVFFTETIAVGATRVRVVQDTDLVPIGEPAPEDCCRAAVGVPAARSRC